jgi:hypothetical protein
MDAVSLYKWNSAHVSDVSKSYTIFHSKKTYAFMVKIMDITTYHQYT